MKVMIDTNIIISAILFPNGVASAAFIKSLLPPYEPITSDYVINELNEKFKEKFPTHLDDLNFFIATALKNIKIISTPCKENEMENKIRDIKDRPIIRTAISANADYILTGDKDFLEAKIDNPISISAADFVKL